MRRRRQLEGETKKKPRTFGSGAGMLTGGTAKSACSEVVCDGTLAAVRYVSHLIMAAAYGAMTAGCEF